MTQIERDLIYHSGRFFMDPETGNVYSMYELLQEYDVASDEIELDSGAKTFWEYLDNCIGKNGFLEEMIK